MPTCTTCGENEFHCIDGLFYCALCQTQSQDVRVEEGEDFIDGMGRGTALKQQKEKPQTETKDKGRLWTTHEGFQYIILEQVNALIELGASKDIKEGVWRLWVMYLSKLGVAFTNTPEPLKKTLVLKTFPRHRDILPGNVDNPVIKPLRLRKTNKEKRGAPIIKQKMGKELEGEEFYMGDNPDSEEEDVDEQDMLLLESDTECHKVPQSQKLSKKALARVASNRKDACFQSVERMSLRKTIGFCYLGLLLTGSLSGPGDLTRWIRQGRLPYFSASSALPDDMKLSIYDKHTLDTKMAPKTECIRKEAFHIAKFLSITDKLPVPDITLIIHRHIHSLYLPADLHGLTMNLLKSKPPHLYLKEQHMKHHGQVITDYDIIAMAYIITTLKLLLGLDDNTERKLSTYARKVMDMLSTNQPLFVWEEWYQYMERREAEKEEFCFLKNHRQIAEVRETKSLTEHLEKFSNLQGKLYDKPIKYSYKLNPEVRRSLQQCYTLLGEKWIERGTHRTETLSQTQPEAFDKSATQMEHDPIGFLVDSPKKQTTNDNTPFSQASTSQVMDGTGFRKSSLRYITNQDNFLEELDKQGLSDFTIYSSCLSSSDDQSDEADLDQSNDTFQSTLPNSPIKVPGSKKSKRKKHRQAKEAVLSVLSQNSKHKRLKSFNKQDLIYNFEKAYENYRLYSGKTSTASRHQSYDWLLKLCAKTIDCSVDDLDIQTQNLQVLYFGEMDEQDHGTLLRSSYFFSVYFSSK